MDVFYYFSTLSTWSYVGADVFRKLDVAHRLSVRHKPVNLLTLFEATGGLPAGKRSPQRQAWRRTEMQRWAKRRQLAMNFDPAHWPFNPRLADGAVIAATLLANETKAGKLADMMMKAVWEEEKDLADQTVVAKIVEAQGMSPHEIIERSISNEVSTIYRQNTQEAIEQGVFGAPTYRLGDDIYWGQDRLDMLQEALTTRS
jgi:2-hydroxychromene-2-carboxylate isomerase